MKKIFVVLIAIGFMACSSGEKNVEQQPAAAAEIVEASINIGGMTCEHCVASVEKGINGLEGIENVVVTLDDSTAVVKYDAASINMDDIEAAVNKRGYTVKSVN